MNAASDLVSWLGSSSAHRANKLNSPRHLEDSVRALIPVDKQARVKQGS
jgi:hypothetical protein